MPQAGMIFVSGNLNYTMQIFCVYVVLLNVSKDAVLNWKNNHQL